MPKFIMTRHMYGYGLDVRSDYYFLYDSYINMDTVDNVPMRPGRIYLNEAASVCGLHGACHHPFEPLNHGPP